MENLCGFVLLPSSSRLHSLFYGGVEDRACRSGSWSIRVFLNHHNRKLVDATAGNFKAIWIVLRALSSSTQFFDRLCSSDVNHFFRV